MKSYNNDPHCNSAFYVNSKMQINLHEKNIVTYFYIVNENTEDEFSCEFGLLSEVGEKWQNIFKNFMNKINLKTEIIDTDDYYGEKLVTVGPSLIFPNSRR
jgi:hypothetical protein